MFSSNFSNLELLAMSVIVLQVSGLFASTFYMDFGEDIKPEELKKGMPLTKSFFTICAAIALSYPLLSLDRTDKSQLFFLLFIVFCTMGGWFYICLTTLIAIKKSKHGEEPNKWELKQEAKRNAKRSSK